MRRTVDVLVGVALIAAITAAAFGLNWALVEAGY